MILKNITATKTGHRKCGLIFTIIIELEDKERHIHRSIVNLEKGMEQDDAVKKVQDLAAEVRDV